MLSQKKSRVASRPTTRSPPRSDLSPPYEEPKWDIHNTPLTEHNEKVASTIEFAHILPLISNEESLLEQIESKTTFILSTNISTSPAPRTIKHSTSDRVPDEECPTIEEPNAMTLGYKPPLSMMPHNSQ